ncbi:MAG: hypothetical protein H6834_15835 [Planctomycetes bacterium]|nr:hypothetical protein [Planctomycetota bacterium]
MLSQRLIILAVIAVCGRADVSRCAVQDEAFRTLLLELEAQLDGDGRAADACLRFHVRASTLPGLTSAEVRAAMASASPSARGELALLLVGFEDETTRTFLARRLAQEDLSSANEAFAVASACAFALGIPSDVPSQLDLADPGYRREVAATYERLAGALAHRTRARARTSEWVRGARRLLASGQMPPEARHALQAGALALLGNLDPTFGREILDVARESNDPALRGVLLHALSYASGVPWLEDARTSGVPDPQVSALETATSYWEARASLDAEGWVRQRQELHGVPPRDLPRELRVRALLHMLERESPLERWTALEALNADLDLHLDLPLYFFPQNRRQHSLASVPPGTLWKALRSALATHVPPD